MPTQCAFWSNGRTSTNSCRLAWLFVPALILSTTAAAAPPAAMLHLRNGGFVSGELTDSRQPNVLGWQATAFVSPFEFALSGLTAVHFPVPPELPRPTGDYCFELAGGDVVFGNLLGLGDNEAEIEVPRVGRLRVERSVISRMYRWRSTADLIYIGPNGLVGWHEPAARKVWREEQGQPWTDQDGALIRGDFKLPARATLEFEISWKNKPDFVFALGVGDSEKSTQRAFRFEVWERDLIIQRETEQEADVASVGEVAPGPGRVHLLAYLDQQKGRILVFSADGKPVADLKVGSTKPESLGGISLANKRGDLRLERLRISHWNGEPPREVERDRSRIHRVDGSIVYGQVSGFDSASKSFLIREDQSESRIPQDQIAGVFLSLPDAVKTRSLAAVYQDGSRYSGELEQVEKQVLKLRVPGIQGLLSLPLEGLRSLVSLRQEGSLEATGAQPGTLEVDSVRLPGRLVDSREQPGSSCLVWQPRGSIKASPLRPSVSGRIVYREPAPAVNAARQQAQRRRAQPQPQAPGGFVAGFLSALSGPGSSQSQEPGKRRSLHLRTGDVIPCDVTAIDENGVSFRTSLSPSTFVAHDKVKAVELAAEGTPTVRVTKAKRERLMTLPRMQKGNPPTHLIRSRNGDYLRGRLIKMDDKTLQIEVRLETKDVARDRLASIIWLHADELDQARKGPSHASPAAVTRVQAVRNDGIRLTFDALQVARGTVSGKSDVLGTCQVNLREVDQFLIGDGIEKAAAALAYQQWKLKDAPEPKAAQDAEGASPGGRAPGTESALVGKPAPDFELDLLGGAKFRLTGNKGKVVVLDFWATWCGPCLQAMPQVEKVAGEFRDRGVQLIAVNLQEEPKQISAMLERHKLNPTVALDRDGAVAEKYAANAIPQTVIIKGDGTVARLFVGGGPHLGDQLREALTAVLKETAVQKP